MAVCAHTLAVEVSAQTPADATLPAEVAAREPRVCVLPHQPPYEGRSLWNANLWPGGVVPYEFDANTTQCDRDAIRRAMDTLEAVANVRFVVRTSQSNSLHIQESTGNNSNVGMIGGQQIVNIYNWNSKYIMCHELLHAIGVWHEQSRPDRDQYITVNYGNIQAGQGSQYDTQSGAVPQGAYDFDSVMHYGACDFSTCCPAGSTCSCASNCRTMTAQPAYAQFQSLMGQRSHLSAGDQQGLVSRYGSPSRSGTVWTLQAVSGPSPRRYHEMVYDAARGVTVLFGGNTAISNYNGDTWEWDGTAWTYRAEGGPLSRWYHGMAYDSARGVTVLYGGTTGQTFQDDTWEWNGATWALRGTVSLLQSRWSHKISYLPPTPMKPAMTMLFGGIAAFYRDETWQWQGGGWSQRFVDGPSPRGFHAMVYDAARDATVLFGGVWNGSLYFGDTWKWAYDPMTSTWFWAQLASSGPSPRYNHAMAYDAAREVTVLFGGNTTTGPYNGETWEWNGAGWNQRMVNGPSPRNSHAMAYDTARGVIVLFGGDTTCFTSGETWEFGPCTSPSIAVQPTAQTVCASGSASFTVTVTGSNPFAYQWRHDGVDLGNNGHVSGVTTATLTISPASPADAGSYDCVVGNACGAATSIAATLTICPADFDCDGQIAPADVAAFVSAWFASLTGGGFAGDFDGNGVVTPADVAVFVTAWFNALINGC